MKTAITLVSNYTKYTKNNAQNHSATPDMVATQLLTDVICLDIAALPLIGGGDSAVCW